MINHLQNYRKFAFKKDIQDASDIIIHFYRRFLILFYEYCFLLHFLKNFFIRCLSDYTRRKFCIKNYYVWQ